MTSTPRQPGEASARSGMRLSSKIRTKSRLAPALGRKLDRLLIIGNSLCAGCLPEPTNQPNGSFASTTPSPGRLPGGSANAPTVMRMDEALQGTGLGSASGGWSIPEIFHCAGVHHDGLTIGAGRGRVPAGGREMQRIPLLQHVNGTFDFHRWAPSTIEMNSSPSCHIGSVMSAHDSATSEGSADHARSAI